MKEIQVEILPDGMAIEVNELGDEPIYKDYTFLNYEQFEEHHNIWQLAESQRRVFKIVGCACECGCSSNLSSPCSVIDSIHTAEIIEGTNKCIIV